MKSRVLFIMALLLPMAIFAQKTTEAVSEVGGVVSGMSWVTFLTPIVVYLATLAAKALFKIGGVVVLIVVPVLSSIAGYILQVAGQTEQWYFVALLGLASVFVNELLKKLTEAK